MRSAAKAIRYRQYIISIQLAHHIGILILCMITPL